MPHVGLQPAKPIHERSGRELILLFVVIPVAAGIGLATSIFISVVQQYASYTWRDWLAAVWGLTLSAGLILALPAAAWREWKTRKQFRHAAPQNGGEAGKNPA